MGLISVMLVTLIGIQLVWLRDAADAGRREKQLRIDKALNRMADQLRNLNYCVLSYSKVYVNTGELFYMTKVDTDGSKDTVAMFYDERYTRDHKLKKTLSMRNAFPVIIDMNLQLTGVFDDTASYYNERKAFYENLTGKKYNDVITSKRPVDSLLDMAIVDSIIKEDLKLQRIDTIYGFGLISKDRNKVTYTAHTSDSARLLSSLYTVNLFTDNKFIRPYKLALIFPKEPQTYVVNYWLLLSVAVIILLTFSFYTFIRLYLRQSRLSEMKTDFINNLTHEFNTPMANISLALETLEGDSKITDPKSLKIINIISTESARLRENIERSLQVAILEEGTLHLHKEEVNLVQLVNTVVSAYQFQCEALEGKIIFLYEGNPVVCADEAHILNCVVNLLDNAIKYRSGPPEIMLDLEEREHEAVLIVSDNGLGMNAETQQHIFEKFYRAHEGDTHNTKGFGLGLSYVKGIINLHRGTIHVWSKKGTGTKFTIRLPKKEDHGKC